ncbi:MAG: lactoylglutathione lyase [Hyphomicrobiales bacterium]|nr:MAG: lactoylglutathione lyase [Hyphomicrobiales bacterium]
MMRGVDHLVLPVEELDIARARYEALGFTVAPDARHPFGTENACVFFANRTYLEPLAVGERAVVEKFARKGLTFLRRYQAYRFRHGLDGFAMMAVTSEDAKTDHAVYTEEGFAAGDVFTFDRQAADASGNETTIGVRLAFAIDENAPDATFFSCQHINTDVFWHADRTTHSNGALGLAEIILTEDNPTDFQYILQTVTGQRDPRVSSFGMHFSPPKADVSVLSPAGFEAIYGEAAPNAGRGLRFAAFVVGVESLSSVSAILGLGDVDHRLNNDMIVVPPAPGQGTAIVFKEVRP